MMRNATDRDAVTLEGLIDALGLAETLNVIAGICAGKADHIREAWQDESLAKVWDSQGVNVSETADKAESVGL